MVDIFNKYISSIADILFLRLPFIIQDGFFDGQQGFLYISEALEEFVLQEEFLDLQDKIIIMKIT